ncbi:hypothetical protein F5148DRAFT_1216989 [Russula earlei]|uniref:Uncharacterized protein n=1 Tax=Russula earlei TaxID=71964 RepID=A0ACC0U4F2_9AGAM|nr:hypothetical protein F5148DRAFT_1216989 [Russula earlei]
MPNSLTRRVGLTVGPLFLETLVKHYFARVVKDASKPGVPLLREELLYDEAFNIVKDFLDSATRHTVEELQSFCNVRTPSPPWVLVVRLTIPMSSCDEAAVYLIKAFRGEQVMKSVVGGTKWWQVRGIRGLRAEWISAKKDWRNAKRRAKKQGDSSTTRQMHNIEGLRHTNPGLEDPIFSESEDEEHQEPGLVLSDNEPSGDCGAYQSEMDEMRCILYSHGGGYYFGSVDQERYTIQRYARKIRGRVLAVNYRLAPQYPFPCAIQDLLAAYLFLIRPPEGSAHRPVKPERIVIAGDSAGGGLSLALLQVIRDAGLPAPAGGVLISPWCDFTHSFPSIYTNTNTDVIPATGLALHKPSPLWPPPTNDISDRVHTGLRKNITDVLHRRSRSASSRTPQAARPIDPDDVVPKTLPTEQGPIDVGSTASLPLPGIPDADESVILRTADGEMIEVAEQLQLYAPNGLLRHPLISPALSYLGGLPPLLFIAGDREVLRDEIIFAAHRAAHPERFSIRDETKKMYPAFRHVEMQPTPVHLQVYDDVAHVLPILFPFTTPGKYCYRAMTLFFKHVTNPLQGPPSPLLMPSKDCIVIASPTTPTPHSEIHSLPVPRSTRRRSFASGISRAASNFRRSLSPGRRKSGLVVTPGDTPPSTSGCVTPKSQDMSDESVAGSRIDVLSKSRSTEVSLAGEAKVYKGNWSSTTQAMIRERVSTRGVIRPLEPESELPAMQVPSEMIGTLSERAIRRYVTGKGLFDKKFASTIKRIEKRRLRNIDRASRNINHHIAALHHYLDRENKTSDSGGTGTGTDRTTAEPLSAPSSWNMAWALDEDERPPASSIVARRDTEEALKLARVADEAVLASERMLNANNLWNIIISYLTITPERRRSHGHRETQSRPSPKVKAHVVGGHGKTGLRSFLGRRDRDRSPSQAVGRDVNEMMC